MQFFLGGGGGDNFYNFANNEFIWLYYCLNASYEGIWESGGGGWAVHFLNLDIELHAPSSLSLEKRTPNTHLLGEFSILVSVTYLSLTPEWLPANASQWQRQLWERYVWLYRFCLNNSTQCRATIHLYIFFLDPQISILVGVFKICRNVWVLLFVTS